MAKQIENLPAFIAAAQADFWATHPEMKSVWHHFLGCRISDVQRGDLDEAEYIRQNGRADKPA